ncbi:zinc finger HIT domain-containing protein 2 [Nothobranchius furzeri]|uniref:Zinc finger HIT-type containing 2 n=1 Tax=Nothobranchius furzeri TaxID=105023 RepID=A0A1A8AZ59_NOTFU|nr:zinc finger HIT domain-containing protein 2 [Nothobranchius furzeri]KAF7220192.1 zinc finger HIT-type containing 2 [Nothobranchius furzeri]
MNPLIRRRLPPSVRSFLTDIGPKEDERWTDVKTDTETKDGILLPARGAGSGKDELLSPAKIQGEKEDETNNKRSAICMLCKCKASNYTCPRCNLQYCGLSCYQSPDHSVCSEEFYKESVLQELKEMGKTGSEGRKKMQEILLGLRHKAEMTHGGMEKLLKDAGIVGEDTDERGGETTTEKVQVLEHLSRLAELQQSGDGNIAEIEAILRKLEEMGGEPLVGATGEDADSKEGEPDLAERLSGMDIDKLSEEELWQLLSGKEQEKFLDLVKGGTIGELVPLWKPWWEEHEERGGTLVEVLKEEASKAKSENISVINEQSSDNQVKVSQKEGQNLDMVKGRKERQTKSQRNSFVQRVPPISAKIPKMSSLCANPSPLACYGLVNALYAYTFSLCLFNGDTDSLLFELCEMTLSLSEALNSNKVFHSVQEALDCGESLVLHGGYFDRQDPLAPARAVEAVAHIMTGRDRQDKAGYCLAALSQLRTVFSKTRMNLSKESEDGAKRQKYFLACKKCEFFQAWVLENIQQIQRIAIELWSEHSRRASVRDSLEKAKTVVEKNMKKEKTKGNVRLIEELS